MAEQRRMVCDRHRRTVATETVTLGYRGTHYEIELCAEDVAKYDATMAELTEAARIAGRPPVLLKVTADNDDGDNADEVEAGAAEWSDPPGATSPQRRLYKEMRAEARAWGRENGWEELGPRGRTPDEVFRAWKKFKGWRGDLFAAWNGARLRGLRAAENDD
jgi:hypothetical protein